MGAIRVGGCDVIMQVPRKHEDLSEDSLTYCTTETKIHVTYTDTQLISVGLSAGCLVCREEECIITVQTQLYL